MDTQRAFTAIALSFFILLGYQYFFIKPQMEVDQTTTVIEEQASQSAQVETVAPAAVAETPQAAPAAAQQVIAPAASSLQGRDIQVETDLYSAVFTENGGGLKSFKLKEYMSSTDPDSDFMEIVTTKAPAELPLFFSWGVEPKKVGVPVYSSSKDTVNASVQPDSLTMTTMQQAGLEIKKTFHFDSSNYLINMVVDVTNNSPQPLQGAPYLSMTNNPFANTQRFLFSGPAVLIDDKLEEIKPKDLAEAPRTLTGNIGWAAYEGTYFICTVIPGTPAKSNVTLSAEGDKVNTLLSAEADLLPASTTKQYSYTIFFGPKKLSLLTSTGYNLDKIVNFGWFDVVAKPTLYLLNFIYGFTGNYGIAIILVTILMKTLLWPIAHKGMKSMKNMQKIQPKMAQLREKYKNDSARLNQEMMNLYKTYKVNPLGGCLPMILQIPVFFALYKVLLQAIELRHAPFMLWITDLSAPDRLWIGFDLPFLGGIPVLTLLMGGSMFLQQKMSPTAADPTQAKIMMFMPVIFTFMFLNFASGLVLYWFVNNLLSIGQQYMVNRPSKS
jgi:YidC/Oxa1 family membrane protein insertase